MTHHHMVTQARDDSWDFKSDGLDGWETRSGSSRGRSQDLDSTLPSPERLPSVGEAAHRVDTAAADKRIFTKVRCPAVITVRMTENRNHARS